MLLQDWIGAFGVSVLLIAFVLNLLNKISLTSVAYTGMNTVGAALAGVASLMIPYWPFVILECIWTLASLIALIRAITAKM